MSAFQERKALFKAIGRKRLASELGLEVTAVNNAVKRGIPATWYAVIQRLCCDFELPKPPMRLFNMLPYPEGVDEFEEDDELEEDADLEPAEPAY